MKSMIKEFKCQSWVSQFCIYSYVYMYIRKSIIFLCMCALNLFRNFKKQNQGGDEGELININNFWLKVLKASYTEFISKKDEKILVVNIYMQL